MVKQAERRGRMCGPQGWAVCTGARWAEPGTVTPPGSLPQGARAAQGRVLHHPQPWTFSYFIGSSWGSRSVGAAEGSGRPQERRLFLLYPAWFRPLHCCPRPGLSANPQCGTSPSPILAVEQTGRECILLHHQLAWPQGCHSTPRASPSSSVQWGH